MSKVKIRCDVLLGLFDSEYYVLVNGSSAYYVHKDNVTLTGPGPKADESVRGEVLGYLIDNEDDKALVQLPGEPVLGSLRTWVDSNAVSAA